MRLGRREFVRGAASVFLAGGAAWLLDAKRRVERAEPVMGTAARVTAFHDDGGMARTAVEATLAELRRLDLLMSPFREGGEVRRLNEQGVLEDASDETLDVLRAGKRHSELSGGAFDIAVGSDGGWRDVVINGSCVRLENGARVDVCGVGVGYSVDRAAGVLRDTGVEHGLVNVGGDVRAVGSRGFTPWRVAVRDPFSDGQVAVADLSDLALTTSGNYERRHIVDPETGAPPRGLASVTTVAERCVDADALATAAFVLGPERGSEMVEGAGDGYLFVAEDGDVLRTKHFSESRGRA